MIAASFLALTLAGSHPAASVVAQTSTPGPTITATGTVPPTASAIPSATPVEPAVTATPSAASQPAPAMPPVPTLTPAPSSTQSPSPTPLPTQSPAPTPSPFAYRFVPHQPNRLTPGQPQIFAIYLNAKRLRSHAPIRIKVETSPDVVKVVSRSNGREGLVPLITAGVFEANGMLPKIPFIAAGMSVDLEFIATGPDGRKVTVRVPVMLDS